MRDYSNFEKSLKRFLKRKVNITLGFIVAFLLSCSFVSAENLEITQDNSGEILFNGEIFDEKNHEFEGNIFDGTKYINNNKLDKLTLNKIGRDFNFENSNIFTYLKMSSTLNSKIEIKNDGIAISGKNIIFNINENSDVKKLENSGVLNGENGQILLSYGGKVNELNNSGIAFSSNNQFSIMAWNGKIDSIKNNGILASYNNQYTIWNNYYSFPQYPDRFSDASIEEVSNVGSIINIKKDKGTSEAISLHIYDLPDKDIDNKIVNKGKIIAISNDGSSKSIFFSYHTAAHSEGKSYIENRGMLFSKDTKEGVYGTISVGNKIINSGLISKKGGKGVTFFDDLTNYGVISANKPIFYPESSGSFPTHKNLGLYLNEEGYILKHKFIDEQKPEDRNTYEIIKNQEEKIINNNEEIKVTISTGGASNPVEEEITVKNKSGKTIINAGSNENGLAQSIKSDTIKNLKEDGEYILNGYDKTVVLNSTTGDKNINNSIINAVKNAVTFDGDNLTLGLDNTIINGGYGIDIISGDNNKNTLNINGESIVNGNISLGGGNDSLSLGNTVQINGTLDGGDGKEDTLVFNSSTIKSEDKNINILYDIKNFEKTDISSNVTLFEKTIDNDGNIKNLEAQLGDITIKENGNLNLRVDGTEKDTDGKVTGHALANNIGSITLDGGKLNLKIFGFGEEEVIAFNKTDITGLKIEDIIISSPLHEGEINSDNTITVSAKKDLEDLDIANYDKLNKIYHSILNSENTDKFTVEEEQYGSFVKYLHDIYVANPYAYSSELSRKTMGMMKELVDKDLKPDYKEWAIYGGFTHTDGGTENSYYGKGYYTYDIGSRDISADTKISGGYFKAEYGKEKDLTTGIIFGGNNSETEIDASKVEGDSFYFGTYAKKYLNNFRFTFGAGFQHGDYKADRTAIGYDGITETRKFSENYHDRGFNIYGNTKYTKELGNGFYFEPSISLEYSYVDQDGASEDGVLAIETDSKNFDYMTGTVNLDIRKEIKKDKFTHSLIAGVSYERMLSGYDEEHITGRMKGGTNFDILVPEKEKDIFSLNVKYELETEKGFIFDVKGSYRFEHDTDKDEWIVGTGIGYRF